MKTGRTIQEIGAEILRQSQAKEDYLVNTNSIVMEDWDGKPMLHLRGENGLDLINPLEIQQTAHRQIGDYLGIPRKYYDRMLGSDVGLLSYNVNRWFQREPEQRMIRTMDGRARAFLSNRYRRIDNLDIARVTLPIIGEMPEARYESCQLTEDYLYIKVVNPRLTAEVTPGDIVQAGIIISNSETGQGSVCVQPLVYRLVCSNGMVVNDAKARRTHLGRASNTEEDFVIYSQETLAADDIQFSGPYVFALDGNQLACDTDPAFVFPRPFTASKGAISHLKLFGMQDVQIEFGKSRVRITDSVFTLDFRIPSVDVYAVDKAIPQSYAEAFTVFPKDFLRELKYLKGFAVKERHPYVRFRAGELVMPVSSGTYRAAVQCVGENHITFAFDVNRMIAALRQFKDAPSVQLRVNSPVAPFIIEAEGRSDLALVCPIRLSEKLMAA